MPNTCWLIHLDGTISQADPAATQSQGFARDFYLKILSSFDERKVNNLRFYICMHPPASLPEYGLDVVLVILSDEYHISFSYFNQILGVLRCYGTRPRYLDSFPISPLRCLALLQFVHKYIGTWKQSIAAWISGGSFPGRAAKRTLQLPLGCFAVSSVEPAPFASREIDFAFLGSIGTSGEDHGRMSLRNLFPPPKIKARREMVKALTLAIGGGRWKGVLEKTTTFADSTSKQLSYNSTMAQTKISICPRGSNYETYRFFESCRAGCVIICEPLPDVWFYEGHPGVVIRDWKQLPQILDSLLSDPSRLEALAAASIAFWNERLSTHLINRRIENFLNSLIDRQRQDALVDKVSRTEYSRVTGARLGK